MMNKLILSLCLLISTSVLAVDCVPAKETRAVAASQFEQYLPLLQGKKVGLVVNQTAQVGGCHLVDLLRQRQITIQSVFAPEHGFRGVVDAGAAVTDGIDPDSGLKVWSLYGKDKKPSPERLADIDILVFDIQDVGVRFYTYLSTLHYVMEAAAEQNIPLLVLDRPNPNGAYVDGPVLDEKFRSFVGMHPIPLLHGMTLAELAQMIQGEQWIEQAKQLKLTVIKVPAYQRDEIYDLPVRPSPNLPNAQSVALYPSLGFFEATPMSLGRGTSSPFQVLGYTESAFGSFRFTPVSTPGAALNPPLKDQQLYGEDLRQVSVRGLDLSYLINWHQKFRSKGLEFFNSPAFMDKLAGTDQLRLQIEQGQSEAQIRQSWQSGLQVFLNTRKAYLLYPDLPQL